MSVSPLSLTHSAITTRLRAAGCVFAEDEAELIITTARTPAELAAMVDRRVDGLPLEHVLGWAEFCGLRVSVDPGVFVPRRRSEFLAAQAIDLARRTLAGGSGGPPAGRRVVVVDLCCGSGALGAAVAAALSTSAPEGRAADANPVQAHADAPHPAEIRGGEPRPAETHADDRRPTGNRGGEPRPAEKDADDLRPTGKSGGDGSPVELHAADLDPVAVRCARRNLAPVGGRVHQGDLYEPLPDRLRGRVGVLLASPPYVPTEAIGLLPSEAREHEPLLALDGGADGLDIARRVIAEAPLWLAPGGHLLVETSERQAAHTAEAMARAGLTPRVTGSDELYATAVIGTR
ncbi:class I SAM-dependent methyltransferase [Nonomuraea montanisoli]|uniref:putative protein N(5)-glutamine methyltransferase n=1 Tax=Nonomuraea montanisoli TaxID=2741721 RepID=UPI001F3B99DB|nr:putative protein N(5)-glutamine methyltransferase [Nonomuraea montanisoli]